MSVSTVIVDPDGDTLIILPCIEEAVGAEDDQNKPREATPNHSEFHFKVSMKHLQLASRRAKAMFAGGFKEARPMEVDGLRHWTFEPMFDPDAFSTVMEIIHGKTQHFPQQVSLEHMAEIASIVDDLECQGAVWFFAKMWMPPLKHKLSHPKCDENLARWILIAYVFHEPEVFKCATLKAICCSTGPISTFGLPIRPKIIDSIELMRQDSVDKVVSALYSEVDRLCDDKPRCARGCRPLLLGSLIGDMKRAKLFSPRPSRPFDELGLDTLLMKVRGFQSARIYSTSSKYDRRRYEQTPYARRPEMIPEPLRDHSCILDQEVESTCMAIASGIQGLELASFVNGPIHH
ncbi:hypothetical protein BKA56DRAFT_673725 [Ilyonectria sp. MPI-CAGE-AT-0026]|nr:hypothetical protein BKA56DRAFT_673725 [Ilyonectria sp. MPI-CAGE-AT-0026]